MWPALFEREGGEEYLALAHFRSRTSASFLVHRGINVNLFLGPAPGLALKGGWLPRSFPPRLNAHRLSCACWLGCSDLAGAHKGRTMCRALRGACKPLRTEASLADLSRISERSRHHRMRFKYNNSRQGSIRRSLAFACHADATVNERIASSHGISK